MIVIVYMVGRGRCMDEKDLWSAGWDWQRGGEEVGGACCGFVLWVLGVEEVGEGKGWGGVYVRGIVCEWESFER